MKATEYKILLISGSDEHKKVSKNILEYEGFVVHHFATLNKNALDIQKKINV